MHSRIRAAITALARATPTVEICGFIYVDALGDAQILPCRNISPTPAEDFEIDVQDHINALHIGQALVGVYHSHPIGAPTGFSPADIEDADEMALPLYLVNTGDGSWADYVPASYTVPLEARAWCLGFADCWETPRIYYRQVHGIHFADYERDESYCHEDQGVALANYAREGLACLPPDWSSVQPHDILCFRTDKALPQHFGVFTGNGHMLHHGRGKLSQSELITDRWQGRLHCVFRHASLAPR
jgi:proteasome lid subunit RPN8/RPN11